MGSGSADAGMDAALKILKRHWGYDNFRPLQAEIVRSALSGVDTLGLMPTGGGKSIAFQVPGLLYGGLTIVVTPLISLMKDQVDNLRRRGVKAVYFHSAMTSGEIRMAWERLCNDGCSFLYIAPERLGNNRFLDELRHLPIRLIVVDEAHCISQWGYDFRPSYLGIRKLRNVAGDAPFMALTATATREVVDDIAKELGFRPGYKVLRDSFARDNISYIVRPTDFKINEMLHILRNTRGASIVYVRSRKRTRELTEILVDEGISATAYHAGLSFDVKESSQNLWMTGGARVIVATNAFGMGIDKPDVRVVIHYDMPPSLEEYYQEAGRAGRDGLKSFAVLLRGKRDKATLRKRISEAFPERKFIKELYQRLCVFFGVETGEGYGLLREFDIKRFCDINSYRENDCEAALKLLSRSGYVDYIEEKDTRSRVMVTVLRDELYHLPLSAGTDRVLTCILRSCPGVFSDYVFIYESDLCRETGLDGQTVYESLIELGRKRLISYVPRSRMPYIFFATSREDISDMLIPRTVYEHRLDAMKRRVEAMIDYAYSDSDCRVSRMLAYFGESDAPACGKCDVCRDGVSSRKYDGGEIDRRLLDMLGKSCRGISLANLEHEFGKGLDVAFRRLQHLVDENIVAVDELGCYYIKDQTVSDCE